MKKNLSRRTAVDRCNGPEGLRPRESAGTIRLSCGTATFSWANARACLELSEAAYSKSPHLTHHVQAVTNAGTEAQALVFDGPNYIGVAFRGSQSPEDFIHDAECWLDKTGKRGHALCSGNWNYNGLTAEVHHGFLFDFDSIATDLMATVARCLLPKPMKKVFVTGHSLGGALAVLAAVEFCRQSWNVAGVYTFGQPRVGNAAFVSVYNHAPAGFPHQLGEITFRVVNENDIVPRVPVAVPLPFLDGYRHGGQEIFLCAPNGVLTNPHWWETADSDSIGFLRAMLKHTDVLVGDHYLAAYQKRIQLL
jgi:hypothetical protein